MNKKIIEIINDIIASDQFGYYAALGGKEIITALRQAGYKVVKRKTKAAKCKGY